MGQYHVTVNLTKREFLNPHGLGCGLKLWEQIDTRAGVPTALMVLLACSNGRGGGDLPDGTEGTPEEISPEFEHLARQVIGRWTGDRVAVVGDYAEREDLLPEDDADLVYDLCGSESDRQEKVAYLRQKASEAETSPPNPHQVQDPRVVAQELREKADRLARASLYQDITPLVAAYLERLCGVKYVTPESGGAWKRVVDAQGEEVERTLAPDMVVGPEGVQVYPRFKTGRTRKRK